MNRELDEDLEGNICSSDNEEEIEELVANLYPHYPSYQSNQEEEDIQIEESENISLLGNYGDTNNDRLFLEEIYSPITRLLDLITINYFNGQSNLLELNGFGINEDFGEILIIGEDIILIDKHLRSFIKLSTIC